MENKLPEGWEWKKLGEICTLKGGFAFKSKEYKEKGIPLLRISNITDNKVSFDKDTVFVEEHYKEECKDYLVSNGDILIALSGATTGKYGIYEGKEDVLLNQRVACLKFKSKSSVNLRYIYYYLKILQKDILRKADGAAQPNISTSKISDYLIPFPPLETQQKIVSILEKAEETKKFRAQAEELTQKLLQSVFLEMFGDPIKNPMRWNVFKVEEICTLIRDGEHKTPKYLKEGIPFVTATNLVGDSIDLMNTKKISQQEHLDFCKRAKPEKGDLLISKDGTIGVSKVIKTDEEFSIFVSVILLKLKREIIEPNFLQYLISTDSVQNEIRKRIKGIAIKHIHLIDLRSMSLPIPPFSEQMEFTYIVNFVELVKNSQQQSSLEINNLFDALMQKAFTGELVS